MPEETSILLRLRGRVQGVGFRPVVFRLAHELGLRGWVRNDAAGAEVALGGSLGAVERFRGGCRPRRIFSPSRNGPRPGICHRGLKSG